MPITVGPLAGVRELSSMRRDELFAMGEEASDLARIVDLGVPFGAVWIVGLSDDAEGRVMAVVTAALALDFAHPVVELGSFFRNYALANRLRRLFPESIALRRGDDVRRKVRELFRSLDSGEMMIALGGLRTDVGVRITVRDDGAVGRVASIDPRNGDPEIVAVWSDSHSPWKLDRKTMRVLEEPHPSREHTALPQDTITKAADLADRAQLALGRPVELSFAHLRGRLVVLGVRPVSVEPCFSDATFRRVALLSADEGVIAPLAIDALDRALRASDASVEEARVARFYARAYRRVDAKPGATSAGVASIDGPSAFFTRMARKGTRVATDLTRPVSAVREFERSLSIRFAEFDLQDRASADRGVLLGTIRDRMRTAVEALSLLESARVATLTAITALEAISGPLPRECVYALATIRRTRVRRQADERLLRLARHLTDQLGEIPETHRVPAALRQRWDEVRRALLDLRPLGVDVRPLPYGSDDRVLRAALIDALRTPLDAEEDARREALRRLIATVRGQPLGRGRELFVSSIAVGLTDLAEIKGRIGEALAASMLRLRRGACRVGAHLVEHGMVDEPEDALYLDLAEIEEALAGEPGAYASRVRLRREADARWRNFEPPRRLSARE
jgi:hypothetical protein